MINKITETQLDNITHELSLSLKKAGVNLGDDGKCELNDELAAFLYERFSITVITDKEGLDETKIYLRKTRNVSCNANEDISYEIDRVEWEKALKDTDGDEQSALLQLQHESKVVRTDYDAEIQEVNDEFDVEIEEV